MILNNLKKSLVVLLLLVLSLLFSYSISFADSGIVKRTEADENYKWDLTEIYESREAFEKDMTKIREEYIPKFENYKGKLNNADDLLALFELDEEVSRLLFTGYVFANLSIDLDQTNSDAQEMTSIAGYTYGQYASAISYIEPEILGLSEEVLQGLINDPKLASFKQYLDQLSKQKEHILSEKEEAILSGVSELSKSPKDIFDKVLYADYEYPTIKDNEGNEIKLTNSQYYKILEEGDRDLRKKAFEARSESYAKLNNTLSATYAAEIKKNIFFSKARNYDSSIEAALSSGFIPQSIYDNLVESVNKNLEYLHKYYEIKKNALGLEELHGYDTSIPLVDDYKMELTYDEAVETIVKGLAPLGEEYIKEFKNGINSNWIDAYEDDNKYTGGYQWGSYDTHPYILMNYDNSLDSALTLAHEMGHALNSLYSNKNQDYYNSNYPIFTAEVASTTNELLVMDYLIKNTESDEEKLFLLNKQIENIRGTIYTQVMFSEFEKTVHEMAEQDAPLSAKVFNDLWLSLIEKYNGEAYTTDEESQYTWSRIPHFYMNFYVYKYATSMSAAYEIVNNIVSEEEGAVDKYLEFLGAGGSDYPVEILKNAGVDMNSSEPVDNILKYFGELVDQLEELLEKQAIAKAEEAKKTEETQKTEIYVIKVNDVLWKIAKQYGITWEELAKMNNLKNPNVIFPSLKLVVPAK